MPTDSSRNRIRPAFNRLIGIEDPDDLMIEILDLLEEYGSIPEEGKYFVFVYQAKTPGIEYDQNPLVAVTDVFEWGFRGFNYHWRDMRQYTWNELAGQVYEVYQEELKDLRALPFGNKRINN
jgi:hypothetical protein